MKSLFDILFVKNYNYYIFVLFLGLLGLSFYITKIDIDVKKKKFAILLVSSFFGMMMLFRSSAPGGEDGYSSPFTYHNSGCLIDAYNEYSTETDYYGNVVRFLHYFEDKKLEIDSSVDDAEAVAGHILHHASNIEISYVEDNYDIDVEIINDITENTQHIKKDKRLYIIDNTWKDADTIVCMQIEGRDYFLSKTLVEDIIEQDYETDLLSETELSLDDIQFMNKLRGERDVNQIILLLAIFCIGLGICLAAFNGKNNALVFFLSFPVGISVICTMFIGTILIGMPFRKITILGVFTLLIASTVAYLCVKGIKIDSKLILKQLIAFGLICAFFVYMKFFYMSADSFAKTMNGIMLAETSMEKKDIVAFMEYGMLEPIINGIGWKFHIDFMYAMYALMPVCSIGLIGYGAFKSKKKDCYLGFATVMGCLFLGTNYDFIRLGVWNLSNGTMATMFLVLIICVLLSIKDDENTYYIIAALTVCIAVTRIEGSCYLCLICSLLCGLKEKTNKDKKINIIVGLSLLFWQIALWNLNREHAIFWNKQQSVLVCMGSILIMIWPFILDLKLKPIMLLHKNYYKIMMIVPILACIVRYAGGTEFVHKTAYIFTRHFATSYASNSGAIWGFFFLMIPTVFIKKTKEKAFSVALVIDYLLLTFLILSFRYGDPIHWSSGDSCRRIIQQVMPSAIFLTVYDKDIWTLRVKGR